MMFSMYYSVVVLRWWMECEVVVVTNLQSCSLYFGVRLCWRFEIIFGRNRHENNGWRWMWILLSTISKKSNLFALVLQAIGDERQQRCKFIICFLLYYWCAVHIEHLRVECARCWTFNEKLNSFLLFIWRHFLSCVLCCAHNAVILFSVSSSLQWIKKRWRKYSMFSFFTEKLDLLEEKYFLVQQIFALLFCVNVIQCAVHN